jgi:hypothetical protein
MALMFEAHVVTTHRADWMLAKQQVAMEHGCGDKWGLFASYIPHRVGYQCSAASRHIIIPRVRVFQSACSRCDSAARPPVLTSPLLRRACCATTTS